MVASVQSSTVAGRNETLPDRKLSRPTRLGGSSSGRSAWRGVGTSTSNRAGVTKRARRTGDLLEAGRPTIRRYRPGTKSGSSLERQPQYKRGASDQMRPWPARCPTMLQYSTYTGLAVCRDRSAARMIASRICCGAAFAPASMVGALGGRDARPDWAHVTLMLIG